MIQAIITDIEGTTTSLSFVAEVLFPFSRKKLPGYVREHQHLEKIQAILTQVQEVTKKSSLTLDAMIDQLIEWIDQDQKITPLKTLQGYIWEEAYRSGEVVGHLYIDAYQELVSWHQQGIKLYIYSSGSVYAQKLLFGHTQWGDLTPLFSGFFDTQVGGKREASSYGRIAEEIGCKPTHLLFLSDILPEITAAESIGMKTCLLQREKIDSSLHHSTAQTFDEVTKLYPK
jgi:enolase-phosphatase E1